MKEKLNLSQEFQETLIQFISSHLQQGQKQIIS